MLRVTLVVVTVVFLGAIAVAAVADMVRHGVTALAVVAVVVVVPLAVGILGGLWQMNRR